MSAIKWNWQHRAEFVNTFALKAGRGGLYSHGESMLTFPDRLRLLRWPKRMREEVRPEKLKLQEVLIVTHSGDLHAQAVVSNAQMALHYAALPSVTHAIDDGLVMPPLDSFSVVVLCTEFLGALTEERAIEIREFVRQGGGLVVAHRGWNNLLNTCFGLPDDLEEPEMLDNPDTELCFNAEVFPGARGAKLRADEFCGNYSYRVTRLDLSEKCSVMVTDGEGKPLCWKHEFEKGRTIYWNSVALAEKSMRGFLVQSILESRPVSAMRILGFGVIQIDDSPPPINDSQLEPISVEYPAMNANKFYRDVWYPDMAELRSTYRLAFTHYCVLNYEDGGTEWAKDTDYAEKLCASPIARYRFGPAWAALLHPADELGFHGYNHVPLITEYWSDPAAVVSAMALARRLWLAEVSDQLPASYVPAANEFHRGPLDAILDAFPEIKVISSTYSNGSFRNGGFREFGNELWKPTVSCLPRETAGYVMTDYRRLQMLSQLANSGIWTHYIHPDDVFDVPVDGHVTHETRNPLRRFWRKTNERGQDGLYICLSKWITFVRQKFSWIEFLTTSAAAERLSAFSDIVPTIAGGRNRIWIKAEIDGIYYLRACGSLNLVPACTQSIDILDCQDVHDGRLYVVRCPAGVSTIDFF